MEMLHPHVETIKTDPFLQESIDQAPWVEELLDNLYDHHPETFHHSVNVARTLVVLARETKAENPEYLGRLGLMHDIGKLGVNESTLNHRGLLLPHQIVELRSHPRMTFEMLVRYDYPTAVDAVAHHERQNDPYPRKVDRGHTENQISLMVADKVAGLMEKRVYRSKPFTPEQVMVELEEFFPAELIEQVIQAWYKQQRYE